MTRYEYATGTVPALLDAAGAAELESLLAEAGTENFELVAVTPCTTATGAALLLTFKRPLPEPDPTTPQEPEEHGL